MGKRLVRGCLWDGLRHFWSGLLGSGGRRCARCGLDYRERLLSVPLRDDSQYVGMDR